MASKLRGAYGIAKSVGSGSCSGRLAVQHPQRCAEDHNHFKAVISGYRAAA